MTCYLLHFERPISDRHTTQHYLGYTDNLETRIKRHQQGQGSVLCRVAKQRNIGFTVVRTWSGDRTLERRLKNRKASPRLCPICNPSTNAENPNVRSERPT
jgi:predicted GIY-YIG superfamily endonuclease